MGTPELLTRLNRFYKENNEWYHRMALDMGLSDSALLVLYSLCHADRPCTQREIYKTWHLKKQTLHSTLKGLLRSGKVRMETPPDHPREKYVSLTEQGRLFCEKTVLPLITAEITAFRRLTDEEQALLTALTQKHFQLIREETEKLLNRGRENGGRACNDDSSGVGRGFP